MDVNTEGKYIERAIKGDTYALSVLLQEYYEFLLKYLIKITLNPVLAEDLTQDTMVRCIEKIGTYNGKSKFSSWLITIGTNLYMDYLRKVKRENNLLEKERAIRKIQWQAALRNENWLPALSILNQLSFNARVPIILKHYYGYSYKEVGRMIGVSEGTVKSRVHNGLKVIQKELGSDEEE